MRPAELFAGHPDAFAMYEKTRSVLDGFGPYDVRTSKSQVAFRRKSRLEEVVHPSPAHWMHHLEVQDLADIDDEVTGWLRAAYDRSG